MNPEQRRAHLSLHGQTLLDAWQERCKTIDKSSRLLSDGYELMRRGDMLLTEKTNSFHIYEKRRDLVDKGRACITRALELKQDAMEQWARAVWEEFGNIEIHWGNDGVCTLGVGERYEP